MTRAVLPGDAPLGGSIALYTLSYLTGLLNPAPAGLGAAEGYGGARAAVGVATQAEAAVLSIIVRLGAPFSRSRQASSPCCGRGAVNDSAA